MTGPASSRFPPHTNLTGDGVTRQAPPCLEDTPCPGGQGAFAVDERNRLAANAMLAYGNEFDTEEAVRNFRAYLEILREWDEKEKLKGRSEQLPLTKNPDY